MAYIGALAVFFAVFMIWREYSAFLSKRLSFCRSYLRALTDYKEKMRCYLTSPTEWACAYSDDLLEECGFLSALREGEDFCEAYKGTRGAVSLSEEADVIIGQCFGRLGEGYLDTELEIISAAIEKLGKEERDAATELPKKKKAVGAVLGAVAAGIVILII